MFERLAEIHPLLPAAVGLMALLTAAVIGNFIAKRILLSRLMMNLPIMKRGIKQTST